MEHLQRFRLNLDGHTLNEDGIPHDCDYHDEPLTWCYVEEKSKAGDALGPVAVIQRSEGFGIELGFTYECRVDNGKRRDGLRIAYLVPSDSHGIPVDLTRCLRPINWELSTWQRLDAKPRDIAHNINECILPRAEWLQHEEAVLIRLANGQLYEWGREVVGMFAGTEGVREVDYMDHRKQVLELTGPTWSQGHQSFGAVTLADWRNGEDKCPYGHVTLNITLPAEEALEVARSAIKSVERYHRVPPY